MAKGSNGAGEDGEDEGEGWTTKSWGQLPGPTWDVFAVFGDEVLSEGREEMTDEFYESEGRKWEKLFVLNYKERAALGLNASSRYLLFVEAKSAADVRVGDGVIFKSTGVPGVVTSIADDRVTLHFLDGSQDVDYLCNVSAVYRNGHKIWEAK